MVDRGSTIPWRDGDGDVCSGYQSSWCSDSYLNTVGSPIMSPNVACCICGGGDTQPDGSPAPTPTPTPRPTKAPTSSGSCTDKVVAYRGGIHWWHDSDGYYCSGYQSSWCSDSNRNTDGSPAGGGEIAMSSNTACCICGGGVTQQTKAPTSPGSCTDKTLPDGAVWNDSDGPKYTCSLYYAGAGACSSCCRNTYVSTEACCSCGGGDRTSPDSPIPPDTPSSSNAAGSGMHQFSDFRFDGICGDDLSLGKAIHKHTA